MRRRIGAIGVGAGVMLGALLVLATLPGAASAQPSEERVERAEGERRARRARRRGRRRRVRVRRTERGAPELEVVTRVRTSVQPKSVHLSPDGRRVWVSNFGRIGEDNVFVFDADTLERVGVVRFPGNAVETAFSPDGATAYVSNFRRGVVEVVDTASYAVRHEIPVGANPKFMVLSPEGDRLYVALYTQRRVAVVDTETREVLGYLRTGEQPRGMAMRPNGNLFVASFRSDFVQEFSPAHEELRRFRTCPYPRHLHVTPDARHLVVTCTLNSIGVYDVALGRRVGLAPTGRNPRSLGLSQDGRWAATANYHSSDVTLADLRGFTHRTSEVPGADQLVGLAVRVSEDGPEGTPRLRVFATSWNNAWLYVLEPRDPLPPPPAEPVELDGAPPAGEAPAAEGAESE